MLTNQEAKRLIMSWTARICSQAARDPETRGILKAGAGQLPHDSMSAHNRIWLGMPDDLDSLYYAEENRNQIADTIFLPVYAACTAFSRLRTSSAPDFGEMKSFGSAAAGLSKNMTQQEKYASKLQMLQDQEPEDVLRTLSALAGEMSAKHIVFNPVQLALELYTAFFSYENQKRFAAKTCSDFLHQCLQNAKNKNKKGE